MLPDPGDPRPDRHHHLARLDRPRARPHPGDRARAVHLEAGDLHALLDRRAGGARLGRQAVHGVLVERKAALALMQAHAQPGSAPVTEERAHVGAHLGLAQDQLGVVADALLALVHGAEVGLLVAVAERDVARAVVGEGLRIGLPDLDARGHQVLHGRLEVVVANHAAGDPRCPGGHARLVDHQDVLAGLGEVPGGGEPVDARTDYEVLDAAHLSEAAVPSPRAPAPANRRRPSSSPPPTARAPAGGTCSGPL